MVVKGEGLSWWEVAGVEKLQVGSLEEGLRQGKNKKT